MNEPLDATQLQQIDKDSLIALILTMQQTIIQLRQIVDQQTARIQGLEDQVARTSSNNLPPERLADYHHQYHRILQRGFVTQPQPTSPRTGRIRGRPAQSPAKNMLDHLQQYQAQTLAFLSDFRIPFDNNQAERDLRMLKVKQKIAGTFRTHAGA